MRYFKLTDKLEFEGQLMLTPIKKEHTYPVCSFLFNLY